MIEVMQGSLGSGKSAVAVARAIEHLKSGGVVASNFSLVDGWASSVAKAQFLSGWLYRLFSWCFIGEWLKEMSIKRAQSLHTRYYRVNSLAAIKKIFPRKEAVGKHTDTGGYSEGAGLLILDEAQLVFNSRKWEQNFPWIEFFTQSRKLGWNVILIAHTIEMIDSQIRPLAEYESRFRNLQKVKFPILGFPLAPFPFFFVIQRYAGLGAGASVVADRKGYPLPLWAARLYDSLEVFQARDWLLDTDPLHCGAAPAPLCGVGGVRLRESTLSGPHWDKYLQTV